MKKARIWFAVLIAASSSAQAAPDPSVPNDSWFEAAYALNYGSPYSVAELRETSVYGWRATTKLGVFPNLSMVGSYDYQMYDTNDAFDRRRIRFRFAKAGLQTHLNLGARFQALLQVTRQERRGEGISEGLSGTFNDVIVARGFGYLGGVRLRLAGTSELHATYEYAPLKYHYGDYDIREHFKTVALSAVVPLGDVLKVALTFEQATYTDSVPELQFDAKGKNENILFGLRFAL